MPHPSAFDRRFEQPVEKDISTDTLRRAFLSRIKAASLSIEELTEAHQMKVAEALISCGVTLIPSSHLLDNQFVVSCGVYKAARKLTNT